MATVLVVDDIASNRKLIVAVLSHMGHRSLEAADGADALALARSNRPDLVISDILMPTMDGYEFVRQLRADPALAHTAVIFYTAHYHERAARNLALACGVSRVLGKPSAREAIVAAIEQALADRSPSGPPPVDADFGRDHVRLMTDKLSDKVAELQAANHRLAALTNLNLQLASERDPRTLVENVARGARDLVGARYAVLCIRDKKEAHSVFFTTSGFDPAAARALTQPTIDQGLFGTVMAERRACRMSSPEAVPLEIGLPSGFPRMRAALIAPVASLTTVYGWICLADKLGADAFGEEDERILTILGAQVGRIHENGSLYAEMKRYADRLQAEVAEHMRAVDELRESELRFRQLAESIREVFWLSDPSRNEILYVSPAYEEVWGRKLADLRTSPRDWIDAIHPEDRDRVMEAAQTKQARGDYAEQYRVVRPDGSIRWIYDKAFPVTDRDGRVVRIAGLAEDVTERVQLVQALLEREEALQRAQLLAKLAHVVSGPDGSFESWSETLPRLLGIGADLLPRSNRAWLAIVHPDDRSRFRAMAIDAAIRGTRTDIEYRLHHADGTWIHIRQTIEPIQGERGDQGKKRWFSTLQDVTAQKLAEDELRESDRRFRDMLGNVELVSLMLDREARITYCNDYLLRITGWSREDVLGSDWLGLIVPRDRDNVQAVFGALLANLPQAFHHENEILTRSGERRLIQWNNTVLRSASGEVIGTASIGEDITEKKRAEAEVRRLNAGLELRIAESTSELRATISELQAFSHSVAHDLRAPLRSIMGMSTILLEDHGQALSGEATQLLGRVNAAGLRMNRIIAGLLELSLIGRSPIRRKSVDLSAEAREIARQLGESAPQRKVEFSIAEGVTAQADADMAEVVLENLLRNAWKFTSRRPDGRIEFGAVREAGEIVYYVRDNGVGFDMAHAGKLFAPFARVHSTTEFEGEGIGLATVRRIVGRHGGRAWIESEAGRGTTVRFTLAAPPLPRAE